MPTLALELEEYDSDLEPEGCIRAKARSGRLPLGSRYRVP